MKILVIGLLLGSTSLMYAPRDGGDSSGSKDSPGGGSYGGQSDHCRPLGDGKSVTNIYECEKSGFHRGGGYNPSRGGNTQSGSGHVSGKK